MSENERQCSVENCAPVAAVHSRVTVFCWLVGIMITLLLGVGILDGKALSLASQSMADVKKLKEEIATFKDIKTILDQIYAEVK